MVKSIIDIEVNDEAFKRFNELFEKYRTAVGELPGDWSKFNAGATETAVTFAGMTAALLAQQEMLHEREKMLKKEEDQEKKNLDLEKRRGVQVKAIWRDTQAIAKTVASTTQDLLKWVGIGGVLSGLTGAGGLWGLDALANSVSNTRRQAGGYGIGTGQLQGLNLSLQRYADINPLLENLANAQQDLTKGWAFGAVGLRAQSQTQGPAELLPQLLLRAKDLYDQGHTRVQDPVVMALMSLGLSMDELRRLHTTPRDELAKAVKQAQLDEKNLALTDEINRKWQEFSIQMSRAGLQMKNTFVDALTPMVPELTRLSKAVADTAIYLINFAKEHGWFDKLAASIREFANYLTSPKFQQDVKGFMDQFSQLAQWVHDRLIQLGIIKPNEREALEASIRTREAQDKHAAAWVRTLNPFNPGAGDDLEPGRDPILAGARAALAAMNASQGAGAAAGDAVAGAPPAAGAPATAWRSPTGGGWDKLLSNIYGIESAYGRNAGLNAKSGALGPFQFMPKTAAQYGVTDRTSYAQERAAAQHYLMDLLREFHGDMRKAVAAYNWGQGHLERDIRLHGSDWERFAPKETRGYIDRALRGVSVSINNNTGAHVAVTAGALTGG